jgi:DNA repair protein RadC
MTPPLEELSAHRIRSRLDRVGPRQLSNPELLCLLFDGRQLRRIEDDAFGAGEVPRLTQRSLLELRVQDCTRLGMTPRAAYRLLAAVELGRRAAHVPRRTARIECLSDVRDWAQGRLICLSHEEVWVLCLDAKNLLKRADRVGQGGVHGCGLNPTDILRPAVKHAASSIVLVHNHPSGDPTPSSADFTLTEHIAKACELLGVPLLDHVVVARAGACSALPP